MQVQKCCEKHVKNIFHYTKKRVNQGIVFRVSVTQSCVKFTIFPNSILMDKFNTALIENLLLNRNRYRNGIILTYELGENNSVK